jgi:hypothetical protein
MRAIIRANPQETSMERTMKAAAMHGFSKPLVIEEIERCSI